jgi:hypothetical protein
LEIPPTDAGGEHGTRFPWQLRERLDEAEDERLLEAG